MAVPSVDVVLALIATIRARALAGMRGMVIVVWSPKGGVGKTTLATELAVILNAILIDLDWDAGGATRTMGYLVERYTRIPLLDGIRNQKVPAMWRKPNRPILIPSHPDLEQAGIPTEVMRDYLVWLAKELDQVVVVDTHPGNGDTQFGAVGAADVIVSPVKLATKELNAADVELRTFEGYPVILVPNMVDPNASTAREVDRLRFMAERYNAPIGPVVRYYPWIERWKLATMVTAREPSQTTLPFIHDITRLAEGVVDYATAS